MKKQKQYFINGLILIIIALLIITLIPHFAGKFKIAIEKSTYSEIEFFILCAASLFYLFSPKYYIGQILSIVLAILYYFLFLAIYPFI